MKVKDLSEEKDKIIQLWKADEKVLALILARSIMTDKEVLEFCIESEDVNVNNSSASRFRDSRIFEISVGKGYYDNFCILNQDYWNKHYEGRNVSYKNERSKVAAFNKYLNHICGNKRIKK